MKQKKAAKRIGRHSCTYTASRIYPLVPQRIDKYKKIQEINQNMAYSRRSFHVQ